MDRSDGIGDVLTSSVVEMLVASMTQQGNKELTELEAERFLNALARAQSGVPTGSLVPRGRN